MTPDTGHEAPWHCRGGLHYSSCFISSWRHAPPLCSPPRLLWFSFHHISHDEADLFLKISRSLPSSILPKQTSPGDTWYTWCHRDQVMSHGTLETWRASPLMRCHNDTGARVIYRGLESAKLSRSRGLPSRTTQRHRHNQTHKNTSINFHSSNRVNFDSWPGRADGLNNIH